MKLNITSEYESEIRGLSPLGITKEMKNKVSEFNVGDLVSSIGLRQESMLLILRQFDSVGMFYTTYKVYSFEKKDEFVIREENLRLLAR